MGIGMALARRFAEAGAKVAVHGFSEYDVAAGHKSAAPNGTEALAKQLHASGLQVTALATGDLAKPGVAENAVEEAASLLGGFKRFGLKPRVFNVW